MEQYTVTGMSCAACSARVEKAVSKVPGVSSCSVSLLTNSMGVEGTARPEDIIAAVEEAGYGASQKGADAAKRSGSRAADEELLKDKETPVLRRRLIASLCFLIPLMYVSMGHMMGAPLPPFLTGVEAFSVTVYRYHYGDQSEIFYQRLSEHPAPGAQHGRSGGTGIRRVFSLQHLCIVCHDRRTDAGRCSGSYVLYA